LASMMVHSACLVASSAAAGVPEGSTEHWSLSGDHTRLILWPLLVSLPSLVTRVGRYSVVAASVGARRVRAATSVLPCCQRMVVRAVESEGTLEFSSLLCRRFAFSVQRANAANESRKETIAMAQTTTQHLPVHCTAPHRTNMHSDAWSRNLPPHHCRRARLPQPSVWCAHCVLSIS
jgi:hypothetical protein